MTSSREKPLDPQPWKCRQDHQRIAIGYTQGHSDCLQWKPRSGYLKDKAEHFKRWWAWHGTPPEDRLRSSP